MGAKKAQSPHHSAPRYSVVKSGPSPLLLYIPRLELLFLNESRCEELVERDEVKLWERRVVEHAEVAVLRYQIVSTGSKGAVHKLVIIRVGSDNAHTKMRVY